MATRVHTQKQMTTEQAAAGWKTFDKLSSKLKLKQGTYDEMVAKGYAGNSIDMQALQRRDDEIESIRTAILNIFR